MGSDPHDHGTAALDAELILAAPFGLCLLLYLGAVLGQHRRGNRWPWLRTLLWVLGIVAAGSGFVGPLARTAHDGFAAHMTAHILVGMVAPLLLVLAAPVTLALRSLHPVPARRLARVLNSPPARIATHPAVAALLNVGGMWALYLTPLYEVVQRNPVAHLGAMLHFLAAGFLYTAALIPVDPAPHKASFGVRATVLVLSLAAHGILAKSLYAYGVPGASAAEARSGGLLMYYAGDAVDLVIIVILCAQWYRHAGRSLRRRPATA